VERREPLPPFWQQVAGALHFQTYCASGLRRAGRQRVNVVYRTYATARGHAQVGARLYVPKERAARIATANRSDTAADEGPPADTPPRTRAVAQTDSGTTFRTKPRSAVDILSSIPPGFPPTTRCTGGGSFGLGCGDGLGAGPRGGGSGRGSGLVNGLICAKLDQADVACARLSRPDRPIIGHHEKMAPHLGRCPEREAVFFRLRPTPPAIAPFWQGWPSSRRPCRLV
jgi:hypothetical protein